MVFIPAALAASTSHTASPTETASSGLAPALRRASSKMSGAGFEFSTWLELTIPSILPSSSSRSLWSFSSSSLALVTNQTS